MTRSFALLFFLIPALARAVPLDRQALGGPELMAPVVIEGRGEGELWMFPRTAHRPFFVESDAFFRILERFLPPAEMKKLRDQERPEGVLEMSAIEAIGLQTDFDERALELRIRIPLKTRKAWNLNLNRWRDLSDPLRPATSSGYLNFRFNQGYQYESSLKPESQLPLQGRVDFVQQSSGFVFETGATFTEFADKPWLRQDTKLVFDNEKDIVRYQVGDVSSRTRGFQRAPAIGGLAVQREYAIEPERTATRISSAEIMLKRDSTVEIWVNGGLFTQMRLPAGRFNLREFPLLAGQNRITVRVRDDFGQEESFQFDLLFDAEVLGAGEHEFAYQIGWPWKDVSGDRVYDSNSGLFSMFHRAGWRDDLTVGFNFQNYTYRYLLGVEAVKAFSFMLVAADLAASRVLEVGGGGGRLRFQTLDRVGEWEAPARLSASHERISESFYPVTPTTLPPNPVQSRSDVQLSKNFGARVSVSIGESWEKGFLPADDRRTLRAGLILSPTPSMRFEFTHSRQELPVPEDRGLITFSWTELPGRTSLSAYHDSLDNAGTVNLSRSNAQPYDDARWNLSYQKGDSGAIGTGGFEVLGRRGALRLEQIASEANGVRQQTTILGADTALVWADGVATLAQPISDSFVMVAAKNFPEGQHLKINPSGDVAQAELGPQSVAVVRDLVAYSKVGVNLDSTTLPPGYLLNREFYLVQPTYRSGLLISIDLTRKVLVRGKLVDQNGRALSLVAGEIVDEKGRLVDGSFFTNREGGFLVEGLEPGEYSLLTERTSSSSIRFRVPSDQGQVLDLGELKEEVR